MSITALPTPTCAEQQLSDALLAKIMTEIKDSGHISFARYMALALYAPKFGYYRNGYQKFGKAGDFVTAPEMTPLFSHALANQCAQILKTLGGGDILEFGAGSGIMAADILSYLRDNHQLPRNYYIIEISAFLQTEQHATLQQKVPDLLHRVQWLSELPTEPLEGVILANEVLDAMPVHQFTYHNGFKENVITIENNQLMMRALETSHTELSDCMNKYALTLSDGYVSEVNLNITGWMKSVAVILSRGALLVIDYGFPRSEYYHPDRWMGTLMCYYRHHSHANPLVFPGLQDMTAHVDFTAVAEAADDNGLTVSGYTHQAAFLVNCDILSLLNEKCDDTLHIQHHQHIMKLTSPNEMGELFKVMGLTKNFDETLIGFKTMNQLARL